MATTGSSSNAERMYSKLIDEGSYESSCGPDVQHSDYPVSPVRDPRLSGPGPYRFVTICLATLCAILLISIIAVTAHSKNKTKAGDEATAQTQEENANVSAMMALIANLQKEFKQLQKEKDELQVNLTSIITGKAVAPTQKATRAPIVCPTNWHLFENSCYLIAKQLKTWTGSQTYCKSEGAHLAIILSAEEQYLLFFSRDGYFVQTRFLQNSDNILLTDKVNLVDLVCDKTFLWNLLPRGHWNSYWFGITDGETEDEWKWINGSPLVGGFWEENEPNNHINEDCGYIVKTEVLERVATKSWYDAPCSMSLPFICEKEMGGTPQ